MLSFSLDRIWHVLRSLVVVLLSPHDTVEVPVLERGVLLAVLLNFLGLLDDRALLKLDRGELSFGDCLDAVVEVLPDLVVNTDQMLSHGLKILDDTLLSSHHGLLHDAVDENLVLGIVVLLQVLRFNVAFHQLTQFASPSRVHINQLHLGLLQ